MNQNNTNMSNQDNKIGQNKINPNSSRNNNQKSNRIRTGAGNLASRTLQSRGVPKSIANMVGNKISSNRNNNISNNQNNKNPFMRKGLNRMGSMLGIGGASSKQQKQQEEQSNATSTSVNYEDDSRDTSFKIKGSIKLFDIKNFKWKLIIFGVIFFFLMIFITIIGSLIALGIIKPEETKGSNNEVVYSGVGDSAYFWWPTDPVNGDYISSDYGYRFHPKTGEYKFHGGVDITASGISGRSVIASKSGTVVIAEYDDSYGNYVKIKHDDGFYTLYAHLMNRSTSVSVGEYVKQGQVIGQVGTTGSSTGPHLHFEVRNVDNDRINPLDYINITITRPVGEKTNISSQTGEVLSAEFSAFLHSWEGAKEENGKYKVYADSTGTLTVGAGVTLKNYKELFSKHGINTSDLNAGSLIDKSIVDDVEKSIKVSMLESIDSKMSDKSINLNVCERQALLSFTYQNGTYPLDKFVTRYKDYGNTDKLYEEHFEKYVYSGYTYLDGLKRRREAEWQLFHSCIFVNNG